SRKAQERLTTSAPRPVNDSGSGSGGIGLVNLPHSAHNSDSAGTSRIAASSMPTFERADSDQPSATRIRKFTEASSRKSTLSANSDTEPMVRATMNSTKK